MKKFLFFLIPIFFIFGIQFASSAEAQTSDYLMINIKHSAKDDSFSILSVDQVVATEEDVALRQSGQYRVSLFDLAENRNISSNYFSFAQDSFLDVFMSEDSNYSPQEENPKIDQEVIVALPLTESADMANLVIRIEDAESGAILLEKPLADTTFGVRSANQFNVNTPPPTPVPIPDNLFPEENIFSKYFWYIVAGIALVLLLGFTTFLLIWRKRKSTIIPLSPPIPPNNST